jgi:hypothetical protein
MEEYYGLIIGAFITIAGAAVGLISNWVARGFEKGEVEFSNWLGELDFISDGGITYNMIVDYIAVVVRAARDKAVAEGWDGEKQLSFVIDEVFEFVNQFPIQELPFEISREQVELLVRGIYQEIRETLEKVELGVL